jgi:hypothetical protein
MQIIYLAIFFTFLAIYSRSWQRLNAMSPLLELLVYRTSNISEDQSTIPDKKISNNKITDSVITWNFYS